MCLCWQCEDLCVSGEVVFPTQTWPSLELVQLERCASQTVCKVLACTGYFVDID